MSDAESPYRTRLYRNGASQAVRIPKDLAFPEDMEVELLRRGDEVIVRPARRRLTGLGAAIRQMGEAMRGFEREASDDHERGWPPARSSGEADD